GESKKFDMCKLDKTNSKFCFDKSSVLVIQGIE
ncbi:unnamed protein product, partial [marine sediment metagenome]